MSTPSVEVYGKVECEDTQRSRAVLAGSAVGYRFHDVEADEALRAEAARRGGTSAVPVIVIGDQVLVEPGDDELLAVLRAEGALPGRE